MKISFLSKFIFLILRNKINKNDTLSSDGKKDAGEVASSIMKVSGGFIDFEIKQGFGSKKEEFDMGKKIFNL